MGRELLHHERGALHPLERPPKKVKTTPKRPAAPGLPIKSEEDPEVWEDMGSHEEASEGESDVRRKRFRKVNEPLKIWSSRERAIKPSAGFELRQQGERMRPSGGGPLQGAFVPPKEEPAPTTRDGLAEHGGGNGLVEETRGLPNQVRADSSNAGGGMQGSENGESVPLEVTPRGKSLANEERPDKAFTTEHAKKTGLANACSGRIFVTIPPDHFGPITAEHDPVNRTGVRVGSEWANRMECRQWGAHFPHIAGIAGQSEYGAQSVALSGGYEDDEDHGWYFIYAGSGGRDLSGNKRTNKEQSKEQTFEKFNLALKVSCREGYPVRVVRSHKEKNLQYAPKRKVVRYDGVYRVEKCWRKPGKQNAIMCRFLFVRCDNEPAPWNSGGAGDRPHRQVPDIAELQGAQDVFERTGPPAWDWKETEGRWGWTRDPPVSRLAAAKSGQGARGTSTTPRRKRKSLPDADSQYSSQGSEDATPSVSIGAPQPAFSEFVIPPSLAHYRHLYSAMQPEDSDEDDDDVSIVHNDDGTRGSSVEAAAEEAEIGSDDFGGRVGGGSEGGEPQTEGPLGKSVAADLAGGGPQMEGSLGQCVGTEARGGEPQTGGSLGRFQSKGLEGRDRFTGVEGGVKSGAGGLLQLQLTPEMETQQDRVLIALQPRKLLFAEEDSETIGGFLLQRSGGIGGSVRQPSSSVLPRSLTPGSGGAQDDLLDDGGGERGVWRRMSISMVEKRAQVGTGGADLLGGACRDSVLDERSRKELGESSHENQAPVETLETPISKQCGGVKNTLSEGPPIPDPLKKEAEPPLTTDRDVETVGIVQDTAAEFRDVEKRPSQNHERQPEEEERAIQGDSEVREGLRTSDAEVEKVDGKMRISEGGVRIPDPLGRISAARVQELEEKERTLTEKVRELEMLVRTSEAKACEMEKKWNEAESRARIPEERAHQVEREASKADARASDMEKALHRKEEGLEADLRAEISKLEEERRKLCKGVGAVLWDQEELAHSYKSGVSETDIAQGMLESVAALAELLQELEGAKEGLAEGLSGRGGLIKRAKEYLVELRGDLRRSKAEEDSLRQKLEASERARGEAEKKAHVLEERISLRTRPESKTDYKGLATVTSCKLSRAECALVAVADCVVGSGGIDDVICERASKSGSGFYELRTELECIRRDYAELKSMAEREAEEHRNAREKCKKLEVDMVEVRDRVKRLAEHCDRLREGQKANQEEECSTRP